MSEDFVTFVPINPRYVPDRRRIEIATETAAKLFPRAWEIKSVEPNEIRLFHAGGNFEGVFCPQCGRQVADEWWQRAMDDDYQDSGFRLNSIPMPCCNSRLNLNELRYEWPMAFARFGLEMQNPSTGLVTSEQLAIMESAIGAPLRVVYMRL